MSLKQVLKKFRKKLRNKLNSRIKGKLDGNTVKLPKDGCIRLELKGKNNTIIFPDSIGDLSSYTISIHGDNNLIRIDSENLIKCKIKICGTGAKSNNCKFIIGKNSSIGGGEFFLYENGSSITIGDDCMISWDLVAWCTDMHSIVKQGTHEPTNRGKSIVIGNHVWIGKEVHITKNTVIPDNCIVGWCSNVTSKFTEPNCIIAGNPARVVKHEIDWDKSRVDDLNAGYPC